jgi:hypothetical protein
LRRFQILIGASPPLFHPLHGRMTEFTFLPMAPSDPGAHFAGFLGVENSESTLVALDFLRIGKSDAFGMGWRLSGHGTFDICF